MIHKFGGFISSNLTTLPESGITDLMRGVSPIHTDWFALIDWRWVAEEMDASLARKMQWVEDHVRQDSPQDQAIQRLMGYDT